MSAHALFKNYFCIRATECATLKGKFSGDFFCVLLIFIHADGKLNRQIRCAVRETFYYLKNQSKYLKKIIKNSVGKLISNREVREFFSLS